MKKNILMVLIALSVPLKQFAQTPVNKSIPVQAGQKIAMQFDYPNLIKVSTWDKNEISVTGTVSINGGENDDAFILDSSTSGSTVTLRNEIRNMQNLPHRITISHDGKKMVFRDKEAFKKYQAEHGKVFDYQSNGVDMDIILEIKVPRNFETRIESVYGTVEIKNFVGPLAVTSTYGGVDAALLEKSIGEVSAETNYGEIYTNFDTKFGGQASDEAFHTLVSAKPGSGPRYSFESKYGNVYLRKAN
jgi:hypothetical protein